ncbi:MAG TPA: hypothetical protein EYQ75_07320 [Planctomycetaceae bacterium]|nr:hypothetical protein [Planctomycetaceae bacterium]
MMNFQATIARWRPVIAIAVALVSAFASHSALAHPAHSTYAEAEWNRESQRIEVAYQLRSYDLEQALGAFYGRPFDLEKTDELDKALTGYFSKHFFLEWESSDKDSKEQGAVPAQQPMNRSVIHWIGSEFNAKVAWVYFELEIDGTPDGKKMVNLVLLDLLEQQTNVVELGIGHRHLTLQFDEENPERLVQEATGKRRLLPRLRPR